jgi:putative DNA primase/helicase
MTASRSGARLGPVLLTRIDPTAPFDVGRSFLAREFASGQYHTLHHHRGAFYAWNGAAYLEIPADDLRARLYHFLDYCVAGSGQKVKPNRALVNEVFDALAAAAQLDSTISPPAWLNEIIARDLPATEIIACTNGLLHLPTLKLTSHTPTFFTQNSLDFAYDSNAPLPQQWFQFSHDLWNDDQEQIDTLQEICGYCLSADTSQQKMFLLVGPKRSGKGTIARVLRRLVGVSNTVSPTLASLSQNFGIAPLIGKRVALVSDARLGPRADQHVIAERLLSITGEDAVTADRKYLSPWTGQLQVRFIILSNELPRLSDASGAVASRFIVLTMRNSFYGREDPGLLDKLLPELPGILNWAVEGWRRLNERGHFVMPRSSADAVQQLEDLGSPIGAFVRDCCVIDAVHVVEVSELFNVWSRWCMMQNRDAGTAEQFGKDLHAAVPGIRVSQPRSTDRRRVYNGIGLRLENR